MSDVTHEVKHPPIHRGFKNCLFFFKQIKMCANKTCCTCIHNHINFCICEHSRAGHMHGLYACQYLKCLCSVYDPCLTAVVQCFKCGNATKICGGLVSFPDLIRCVYRFQYNTCNTESDPCWVWFWVWG